MQIIDFQENNGLVYCQNLTAAKNNAERLYISEIKKLRAHAVLFRRFYEKNNSTTPYKSEPAVCIFKEEDYPFNSNNHKLLHAALWSSGKNEIYIIISETRIDIINARKPAVAKGKNLSLENLRLASSAIKDFNDQRFSAYLFGNGTFWEQTEFEDKINVKYSPYIYLLDYLMIVRKEFVNQKENLSIEPHTIDKLLIICILVKFLEEIKDDNGKHTLRDIYKNFNVNNFAEIVERNYIVAVLNELAAVFNGEIFNAFSDSEKDKINKANLNLLARFLRANIDLKTGQYFLWEQYSFKYLPAEVISAIYENFIQAESERKNGTPEKGVVYTPIHLVNFLIDEVMPLEKSELFINNKFKVLDPSCGSGVFLVAAYKRLLQWWAINNSSQGNIQYPQCKQAQRILEDNIFGVDVKKTATLVSIFGLTTALLDKLTPNEIWNNFKFNDLKKQNIIHQNFFEWALNAKEKGESFDLIIGNPPFNIETNKTKKDVLDPNIINKLNFKHKNIPANNFALHFFEGSMTLAEKVCLIIPSNVLLYNKSAQKYRKSLFTDFTIKHIFDFTHLRRELFHKSADTPVVAIIADNKPSNFQTIKHTVLKRETSSEKKIRFEIDEYDRHEVPFNWAIDEDKYFVWKTNLLGGGRLFHLIYRFSLFPTLEEYIKNKTGWMQIRGFEGGNKKIIEKQDMIIGISKNGAPNILKEVNVETNNLKDEFMYMPPFMIIDQVIGDDSLNACMIPKSNAFSNKNKIYYNRDFIGISVPEKDESELLKINNLIRKSPEDNCQLNFQLFVAAISSSCLVLTETDINKSEILSIPYIDDNKYLKLSWSEKIIQDDVLQYYRNLGKAISKNSSGRSLHEKVFITQLKEFGKVYCEILNLIYANLKYDWQPGNIYQTDHFTIYQFGYGAKGKLISNYSTVLDDNIETLMNDKLINGGSVYKRIVRMYQNVDGFDCIFFIKPSALRYWLKSIALQDADDTFVHLNKEGL